MAGVGEAMKDLLLAQVCAALAGVDIDIFGVHLQPFAFLADWGQQLRADADEAIASVATTVSGITGGASTDPAAVAGTVTGIQDNLSSTAAAIAALQTSQTGTGVGGASVSVEWPDTLTGTLGPGWTLGGQTSTAPWGTQSGVAGLRGNNSYPSGVRYARLDTQMMTDDHRARVVAAEPGNTHAMSSLFVRATSNLSTFVYLNVYSDRAYLGYGSWSGSAWTFHDWTSVGISLSPGATVSLTAEGQTYTAAINGTPILTHTDSSVQSPVGASNRYVGWLSMQTVEFLSAWTGFNNRLFDAADVSSPPVVGTGWWLWSSNTGGVTVPGSSWQSLSASTLDTQGPVRGVTVTDLGRGIITITKSGWYQVSFRAQFTSAAGGSNDLVAGLAKTPAGGSLARVLAGDTTTGDGGWGCALSAVLYCTAGDTIQPQTFQSSGSNKISGAGAGDVTYFTGALISA